METTRKLFYRVNILVEAVAQEKTRGQSRHLSAQTTRLLSETRLKKWSHPIFANADAFTMEVPLVNAGILAKIGWDHF